MNNLKIRIPVELLDHPFGHDVNRQVKEKVYLTWLGVRDHRYVGPDGDLQTVRLRKELGSDWRVYMNLCAETEVRPFDHYKRWGTVTCDSASILKRLSMFKEWDTRA